MDELSWDLLRDFLAVFRAGSVTGAAKMLGVQQSTVSRRLAELEEHLGVELFFRVRSGALPTDAALTLLPDAEEAERSIANLELRARDALGDITGLVRIAAPYGIASHVVLPALQPLFDDYPGIQIDILTGLGLLDLGRREADIALRFVKPTAGDLMAKPLADLEFAVLASKKYRSRHRTKNSEKLDWVGLDVEQAASPEYAWMRSHIAKPPRLVCNDYDLQLEAVRRSIGVALLPKVITQVMPSLVAIDEELGLPMPPPLRLWLVMYRQLRHIPKFARVWEALRTHAPMGA